MNVLKVRYVAALAGLLGSIVLSACAGMPAGFNPQAASDGSTATAALAESRAPKSTQTLSGKVEAIEPGTWTVAGMNVAITSATQINGAPGVGDPVKVRATVGIDGGLTALAIEQDDAFEDNGAAGKTEFSGAIESVGVESWTVAGMVVMITPDTEIDGTFQVGDTVKVEAFPDASGALIAHEISAPAEKSPDENEDENKVDFSGVIEVMGAGSWTVSGQVVAITPDTKLEGSFQVGDTVKVEAFTDASGALVAHEVSLAEDKGMGEDSQDDHEDEFTGTIEAMGADSWTISGQVVAITLMTEIDGTFQVGDQVKVEAFLASDGTLTAKEISSAMGDEGEHEGMSGSDDEGESMHDGSEASGHEDGGSSGSGGEENGGSGGHSGSDD